MGTVIVTPVNEQTKAIGTSFLVTKKTIADKIGEAIFSIIQLIGYTFVCLVYFMFLVSFIWLWSETY